MTHIDLFSGIGGFVLAASWAGFETVAFCEIDEFCQEVLAARFGCRVIADPKSIGRGVRPSEVQGPGENSFNPLGDKDGCGDEARFGATPDTKQSAHRAQNKRNETCGKNPPRPASRISRPYSAPLLIPDIRDFDGSRFRGATLLTGGFPCQPFSCAGKRRGKDDNRHLWPEMRRVIHEARPAWVVGENVAGIINLELEQVCLDLEAEGYEVQPLVIPACAINAPHRRDRVWIVAKNALDGRGRIGTSKESGHQRHERDALTGDGIGVYPEADSDAPDAPQDPLVGRDRGRGDGDTPRLRRSLQTEGPDSDAPDAAGRGRGTEGRRLRQGKQTGERRGRPDDGGQAWLEPWPEVAARLCRVDDGLPAWIHARRVQRLKALGNSIVPAVAYPILKGIAEIENHHE